MDCPMICSWKNYGLVLMRQTNYLLKIVFSTSKNVFPGLCEHVGLSVMLISQKCWLSWIYRCRNARMFAAGKTPAGWCFYGSENKAGIKNLSVRGCKRRTWHGPPRMYVSMTHAPERGDGLMKPTRLPIRLLTLASTSKRTILVEMVRLIVYNSTKSSKLSWK